MGKDTERTEGREEMWGPSLFLVQWRNQEAESIRLKDGKVCVSWAESNEYPFGVEKLSKDFVAEDSQ